MVRTLLLSILVLGLILGSGYAIYRNGYNQGFKDVQAGWEQRKAQLVKRINELEKSHHLAQEKIAHDAEQVRQAHEDALAAQRAVYEQRLSQSTHRATVYRAQAQAGTDAARDLADHAARLDRALEEGLGLVDELTGALGLREAQLRLLGVQLQNDRRLGMEKLE